MVVGLEDDAQQGLDIVHDSKKGRVQVANQGSRERT